MILTSGRRNNCVRNHPLIARPDGVIASLGRARHDALANKIRPAAAIPVITRPGGSVTRVTEAIAIRTPASPQPAIPVVRGAHSVCCMLCPDPPTTAYAVIHKRYQQWG